MTGPPVPSDDQARTFVAGRYGEAAAASLVPAGAGEWSRAFAVRAALAPGEPLRDMVIRFGQHRTDFVKDRIVGELVRGCAPGPGRSDGDEVAGGSHRDEVARVSGGDGVPGRCGGDGAAGATEVPVPRVLEIGATPWGSFVTAERCHGRYLDDLDGDELSLVLPDLLRALETVAGIRPPGPGYGGWDERGVAPSPTWRDALLAVARERPRTAGWTERLAARPGPAAVFRRGLDALEGMLRTLEPDWPDAAGPRRIVHGDLLNRNVLVDPALDHPVTALLDWGNAMYGDPLYDAAWLLFWQPWYPAWSAVDIRTEIGRHRPGADLSPASLDARLLAYQVHIGLDSITYQALTRRWEYLDRAAGQVAGLLR